MAIPRDSSQLANIINTMVRSAAFCVFYAVQSIAINFSQFAALLIWPLNKNLFRNIIIHTQKCYGILLVTITQFFAPCDIIITTDESAKGVLSPSPNCKFNIPEKIILIGNHQIYADWIYIWAFSYMSNMHGAVKIILKASLKWMPIFGWGMQFFDFIFLKRSWASDQGTLNKKLEEISNSEDPMWLLIFPEGTLASKETRGWSQKYAAKIGVDDLDNVLLPHSTGLYTCSQALKKSVHYIYDLTIGFDGVPKGVYPEEIYNLKGIYFQGVFPSNVHMHIRRYAISEIPDDKDKFGEWLRQRWIEKDKLMDTFYAQGRFPTVDSPRRLPVRLKSFNEIAFIWYFVFPFVWLVWNFSGLMLENFNKAASRIM
ncbi:acyltransferase-domain-containing protein [Gigaspora rosea]|uniref:Acyltransferase-domain-containing protein n=1 Tax=Gigaspora rosea TaxID=44941 RepID=A0A397VES2_9GLOM|nr:acyltransferase-domain-containing protein [Gigaspora rosea]